MHRHKHVYLLQHFCLTQLRYQVEQQCDRDAAKQRRSPS